jgi:hypothetical protein
MNNIKAVLILAGLLLVGLNQVGCSASSTSSRSLAASVYYPTTITGDNVVPMSVGACGVDGYENEPCISVTICTPGTSTCQTIDNILVDTGSYGLKIFKSLITIPLTQVTVNSGASGLASCTGYLDGSGHWGQVVKADVKLGNKTTTTSGGISIVTLDSTYANPAGCSSTPDTSPSDAGFNGIIGVGSFVEDCSIGYGGSNGCVSTYTNVGSGIANGKTGKYWACTGMNCQKTAVDAVDQVSNPVAMMPAGYNNGLVMKLPSVGTTGAGAAYGYLILGIGNETNNTPSTVTVFPVENDATFVTTYRSSDYEYAFIDSGTNFNGFPRSSGFNTLCSSSSDFYCPSTETSITATMKSGSVTQAITFKVGNMVTLASANPRSMVFNNIAFDTYDMGNSVSNIPFDWGLPFFLGRSVYVGIKGKSATLNSTTVSGPFWAF